MKKVLPKHTGDKPEPRANSKGASINGRHYIIGLVFIIQGEYQSKDQKLSSILLSLRVEILMNWNGGKKM